MRFGISQLFVFAVCLLSVKDVYADIQGVAKPAEVLILQQIEGEKKILEARKSVLSAREQVLKSQEALVDEKNRNQQVEHKIFTESRDKLFTYTTVALIAGVAIGWLSMMLMLHGWIRKQVTSEIKQNSKLLSDVADAERLESRLKQSAKLLVLTGDKDNGLAKILRNFGFDSVQSKTCPESLEDIKLGDYSQVIFDNFDEEQLRPFVESGQVTWYFAYYDLGQYDKVFLGKHKIALANTRLTLYTRLMELLEWKDSQRDL